MNRLAKETSPYLLQHAHNPVDWYPWGEEALQRAKAEDKPILVSIGYSACHWCHVMERESFEDPAAASYMNDHFINIKVDREERPDIDHIYMDAVQALSGSGGWPLNVFLTPEARPFYGGTYFPPVRAFNRASWKEVMSGVVRAFREQRDKVEEQSRQLTDHLQQSSNFGTSSLSVDIPREEKFTPSQLEQAFRQAMSQADRHWGGFGKAPKFPQTFTINYLIRFHHFTKNGEAQEQALLSLDRMIMGGIYDHVGGGFARYATDNEWLVPHFEKMLYDNALLVMSMCEAFQATRNPLYEKYIRETLQFVQSELMDSEGGFYSALDADSEGVEGKFYTWTRDEVMEVLGEDGEWFCGVYDISEGGNWEHVNIPRLLKWPWEHEGYSPERLEKCRLALEKRRSGRVRPGLDDKVLTGWNALMNQAFCRAAEVLGDPGFSRVAICNMGFLLDCSGRAGSLRHTYKEGAYRISAFLDDHAYMISALLALFQLTAEDPYLDQAMAMAEDVIGGFSDEEGLFFYYTGASQGDVIVRKKEIYDGATPSGNAVMALNLRRLGILAGREDWKQRSESMLEGVLQAAARYPTSFGVWTSLLMEMVHGTPEIAIVGKGAGALRAALSREYIPFAVIQWSEAENGRHPMLSGKGGGEESLFYLCRDYRCLKPVLTTRELMQQIEEESLRKYDPTQ